MSLFNLSIVGSIFGILGFTFTEFSKQLALDGFCVLCATRYNNITINEAIQLRISYINELSILNNLGYVLWVFGCVLIGLAIFIYLLNSFVDNKIGD